MIIGFKNEFVQKILDGTKFHAIREDKHERWKPGITMHMVKNHRTPQQEQFCEKICSKVLKITIHPANERIIIRRPENDYDIFLTGVEVQELAKNDGFGSVHEFFMWFHRPFVGKLIYWS